MTPAMLAPLLGFALLATLTPGGATTLATASGARFGLRRSWPLILGMAAAISLCLWCVAGLLLARTLRAAWQWRLLNTVLGGLLLLSILPMWRN